MVGQHFQKTPSTGVLVEASAPPWAQRMVNRLIGFFQPQFPTAPTQLWVCDKADLPNPANYHGCIVAVRDQTCLVVAQGTSWLKIATAGPV